MTRYVTNTIDTCWKDSIACILNVNPKYVPDFVKKGGNNFIILTKSWLEKNYNKSILFIPANQFMETGPVRYNNPIGPSGFSIGYISMLNPSAHHAVICFNGGIVFDNNNPSIFNEYKSIEGFFIIYPLPYISKKKNKSSK